MAGDSDEFKAAVEMLVNDKLHPDAARLLIGYARDREEPLIAHAKHLLDERAAYRRLPRRRTCMVCGEERLDAQISVAQGPVRGMEAEFPVTRRDVRYCNDRPDCMAGAFWNRTVAP